MVDNVVVSTNANIRGTYVYWVFTAFIIMDFNESLKEEIKKEIDQIVEKLRSFCKFYCMQIEKCPTSDRYHMQGYIHLAKKCGLTSLRNLFKESDPFWGAPHFEVVKAKHKNNFDYCTKEETRVLGPWIWPSDYRPGNNQGCRSDITDVVNAILNGNKISDLLIEHPNTVMRYNKHLQWVEEQVIRRNNGDRVHFDENIKVTCIISPPGCGKTRSVLENEDDVYQLTRDSDRVWFDGYHGQEVLLIDDFNGWITHKFLLKLLDKYTNINLPVKGSYTRSKWKKIFITSNNHPKDWYQYKIPEDYDAVMRRIDILHNKYTSERMTAQFTADIDM